MRERVFVERRSAGWDRLEAVLAEVERVGVARLGAGGDGDERLRTLALLYRATTADLAAAQSRAYSNELRAYLNRLTARAYAAVNASASESGWARVAAFFTTTFPREVRRSWKTIACTTFAFAIGAIVSYAVVAAHPNDAYAFLPGSQIPTISKSLHDSNFGFDRSFSPLVSSEIITNNVKVAMIAFAGGMTLGTLTMFEIVDNGVMMGSTGALFASHGFGRDFWATIAPHGVIELTSIFISGAAGLLLARAIVAPGRLRRIDALKANARRAGTLMIGVAALLCVAGTIEGFVTPQRTSEDFRFGIGLLTAACLLGYFGLAGRQHIASQDETRLID